MGESMNTEKHNTQCSGLSKRIKKRQLDFLTETLDCEMIHNGVASVILIDLAGNILANLSSREYDFDIYSLATLAAGNYGAVTHLMKNIEEAELILQFHKGEMLNIYFKKLPNDYLLITIFDNSISLGFMRLKIDSLEHLIEDSVA
jgi:hypothetical protein